MENGPLYLELKSTHTHLQCTPKLLVLGEHLHLLVLHLLCHIIIGDDAMAGGGVGIFQDELEDVLGEADRLDSTLPQDRLSIHDKTHVVVSVAEHSVDMNNHGSMVLQALAVVGDKELVDGVDGEVCRRFGGEGRHLSYISTLPVGARLPWRGLQLGRHGGVVIVVGGSVTADSVGVSGGSGFVVRVALFIVGDFLF